MIFHHYQDLEIEKNIYKESSHNFRRFAWALIQATELYALNFLSAIAIGVVPFANAAHVSYLAVFADGISRDQLPWVSCLENVVVTLVFVVGDFVL
jgi:predicted lysophospholipase L1 biosynthesis ABC-type transport system permease subunit